MYSFPNGGPPVPPYTYPQSEPPVPIQRHAAQAFTWTSASDRGLPSGTADLGYQYNVLAGRQPLPASQHPQAPVITNNYPSNNEFQILPSPIHRHDMAPFASGRQNNPSLRPIPASSSSLDGWNRISGTRPSGDPQPPAPHSFGPTFRPEQRSYHPTRPSAVAPVNSAAWRTFPFEILPPDTSQQPVPLTSSTHPSLPQISTSYSQHFTVPSSRNSSLDRGPLANTIVPNEVQHSPFGLLIPPPEQTRVKSEPSSNSSSRRGSQDSMAPVYGTLVRSSQPRSDSSGQSVRGPKRKASSELVRSVDVSPTPSSPRPAVQHLHQVIDLGDDDTEEQRKALAQKKDKKPFLACEFCRNRKIACGPGPTYHMDLDLPPGPRTCNQCHRRELECKFPEASRRGLRDGRPSRRVVYGPDNQFKIIIVEDDSDDQGSLEWDDIVAREEAEAKVQTEKKVSIRSKGKPLVRCSWTPIRFVAAVDTEMIRRLVKEGRIPGPGGPPITK